MLDALVRAISMLDYTVAIAQAQSPLPYYQVLYCPALLMDILGHLSIEGSFPPSDNFSCLERV